ncbi:MAG: hypothetical protein KC482_06285 [Dehalococcoidia bacterium]|nr:hypothetical protein [Dehalococcoidia bacterium]MCA9845836.1 hypothetical protein [Dehalococcoidia bacterium]MCA9853192.1 hypothetical protein [Dehalococcoidia bacterium]
MPLTNELKQITGRINRSVARARLRLRRQKSQSHIDRAAEPEARDQQATSDQHAAAAQSPAEEGGEG